MKTILVLTDFSVNALRAAETAAMLSGKLHADLLLFYSNNLVPTIPYYSGAVLVNESIPWEGECLKNLNEQATYLRKIISDANTSQRKPHVKVSMREGDLSANVDDLVKKRHIEMIIMGGRSGSKIDHFLFGSNIHSIIDHAVVPVLIVPSDKQVTRLHSVVFATNFSDSDFQAIEYLMKLGEIFEYHLEIVHITLYGDHRAAANTQIADFIAQLGESKYPTVKYSEIKGKDLVDRLDRFCTERDADLLAFNHQHYPYLLRLLKKSTVKQSLLNQQLPFLIFPSVANQQHRNKKESLTGYIL